MSESTGSLLLLDKTAERFRYFAGKIYADRSPLYTNLALRVAEDPELVSLAASAQEKAALPNLFFAAVHLLLLKGEHHQLAAFYPSLNNSSRHYDYVYPYFRSFVLEHREEIRQIMMTHSVQTNEVGRCAVLVPAFELVTAQTKRQPMAMFEIGSSAGLTLLWDHYHYRYGNGLECGDPNSPVKIECSLRGEMRPPIPGQLPKVASRTGIDLSPIDVNNAENVQWLRALVWPDNQKRARQLEHAIQFVKQAPPRIITGNALELLSSLIDKVPEKAPLCIYHSFTLTLAGGKPRENLHALLTKGSKKRDLFLVWLEWATDSETPLVGLAEFSDGVKTEKILARCHSHGEWLEWMNDSG
ncbi:MAG: hypothetical protein AUI93_03360 [Crenarchaeota archaeon 13_1_40CM_3_52_10]|nr:MAG: hypothetical protein AUI93_03360 [Crenarchaeota archaeon 13_1_40CM_3_52_10]OLE70500.1 MAG: hypothetical protein AUF78_06505 [archaeon 13_1_20CM_2_51_12]